MRDTYPGYARMRDTYPGMYLPYTPPGYVHPYTPPGIYTPIHPGYTILPPVLCWSTVHRCSSRRSGPLGSGLRIV